MMRRKTWEGEKGREREKEEKKIRKGCREKLPNNLTAWEEIGREKLTTYLLKISQYFVSY